VNTSKFCDAGIAAASLCLRCQRRQWAGRAIPRFSTDSARILRNRVGANEVPGGWFFARR
jgi:hypothetical protein